MLDFTVDHGSLGLTISKEDKTSEYLRENPLKIDELGFNTCAYNKILEKEKRQERRRQQKSTLPKNFEKLAVDKQRRSLIFMKQYDGVSPFSVLPMPLP